MIKRLGLLVGLLFALPAAASDWYISPSSPFTSRTIEGTQCRYLRMDSTDSGYTPALDTHAINKAKIQHDYNSKTNGTGASVMLKSCSSPTDTGTCSNFQADINGDNVAEDAALTTDMEFYAVVPPQYLRAQITVPAVIPAITTVVVCGWTGSVPLTEIDPFFKAMDTETELETQLGGLNVWTEADGPLGGGGGGAGPTDIAQGTRTSTTVPITSSTGADATLTAATTSLAGVMTATDKTKLDNIAAGATVGLGNNPTSCADGYVVKDIAQDGTLTCVLDETGGGSGSTNLSVTANGTSITVFSDTGNDASLPAATQSAWGVMTDEDKAKLDGIAAGATVGHGDGANCSAGQYPLGVDASGAVQSCTADDDVPESGDFGAAAGLDADGSISTGAVSIADISATGTPSGTTFLRGDGVWATPPGGGTGINALFDDPAPMLSANLDANGKAIINLNRIGDRNFYVDSLSELVAAESACNDTLGGSDPTGCYIWYTAPSLTISSTLEIAGTGTSATGNNGIHLRGMGGYLSGNNINDAGTVIHWNNATGAPAVQFGACTGCSIKGFLIDGNAQATAGIKAADNVLPLVGLEIANMGFYNINGYAIETQDGGTTSGQGQSDTTWIHDVVVRHSLGTYRSLNSQSLGVTIGPNVQTTWMNGTGPYYDIQYGAVLYRDNYLGINNDGAVGIRLGQSANNLVIQGQNQVEMHSHAGDGITAANASIDNVKVIECEPTANGQAGRVIIDGVQFIADTGTNEALSCEKRGSIQWTNNNWVNGGAVDNTAVLAVNIARDDGFSGNELDVVEFNNFKTMGHAVYTTLPDPWPVTYTNDPDVMRPTVSASAQPLTCSKGEVFVDTDDGNIYTCGATNNWTLKASGSGLVNIVEDTTPQLGGDLDAQQNDITNLGNIVMSPVINTTTATSPTHVKAEDKTVWMNIDGEKYPTQPEDPDFNDPILKTKAIGEEEYFVNLSETEAYGKWLTVIGGGDTDLVGMNIDAYQTGGSQARGDEGMSGLRMFVKDNWLSAEGKIEGGIASGSGSSAITIEVGTITEDESKVLGENKIAVFGTGTNYTLITAPPGTTDGTGAVVAGWELYGGGTSQGQWVLGSAPSINSTGYCLGTSDSAYSDINGTVSRIWLPIIAVSGSTVTTQWLNQGRDAGNPYMYPATPGSAQVNIRPCVVLGPPVFNAGDKVADSLNMIRAAGFPGANDGDTFRVTAYPGIRQNNLTLLTAKNLGGMYPDSVISAGNLLDGSNMGGRMQIDAVLSPAAVTADGLSPHDNMIDGKHHAFKYAVRCDNWDCETLGYYRYTSEPVGEDLTQYPFELNMDTADWDEDKDRIVIRTDFGQAWNLTLDKTGGWGQFGDPFVRKGQLDDVIVAGPNNGGLVDWSQIVNMPGGFADGSDATGGGGFDSTTLDAVTWSDGANASNVWTFDVSGTDHTMTAGNGVMTFGDSVTVTDVLSAPTLTLTGTGTINGLDAIDATTEATIEAQVFDADAKTITGAWDWSDTGTFDFGGPVTATSFTPDAVATPSADFDDSDDTGTIDAQIVVDCLTAGDCDMMFKADTAGTSTEVFRIDTADAGTQTLVMSKDIDLGANNLIYSTGTLSTTDLEVLDDGSIASSEITDSTIAEVDLKVVDTAADEECLTYETTTGDFEWQACGTGTGDVSKVGTPVDNQVGVWTGNGTLEGDADLTFDGTKLTAGSFATAATATPSIVLQDSTAGGEASFVLTDSAGPEGTLDMKVDTGTGTLTTQLTLDGVNDKVTFAVTPDIGANGLTYSTGVLSSTDLEILDDGTITDTEVDNAITASNYLPLAGGTVTGTINLDSATEGNLRLPVSTSLPGTCTLGDTYVDSDADTDGTVYFCRATNTWKDIDDDGGAGGFTSFAVTGDDGAPAVTITDGNTLAVSGAGGIAVEDGDAGADTLSITYSPANAETGNEGVIDLPDLQGVLTVAKGGTGASPTVDDSVLVSSAADTAAWKVIADSDGAGQKLVYDQATNAFSAGTDDDVPEAADYSNLSTSGGLTQSPAGTITTSMNTSRLIGRTTASVGTFEELSLGAGLTFGTGTLNRAQFTGGDVTAAENSNDLQIAADVVTALDLADTLTLDANMQVATGAYGWEFLVSNPSSAGIDINGTGAFAGDLFHVHQHTGNPTGGNLIHAEANDADVTPLVHISALSPSTTGVADAIVGLLVDTDDTNDTSFRPILVQDTSGGTPNTLFAVNYQGLITTASVNTTSIVTDGVDSAEIAANAVGNSEMADNAIGNAEMADNAVGLAEHADDSVGIDEADLIDGDTPADEECLTYESGGANGTWEMQACGGGSSPWQTTSNVANLVTGTDAVTVGSSTALAKLAVDGDDAAEIGLLVQGAGSQSADLFVAENSTGTDQFKVSAAGATTQVGTATIGTVSDPADAGAIRLDNATSIAWEASPAGTDVTMTVDSSEIVQIAGGTLDGADLTAGSGGDTLMAADSIDGGSAGEIADGTIDGEDMNATYAGRSLTETAGTPDVLDVDAELYTVNLMSFVVKAPATTDDFLTVKVVNASTLTGFACVATGGSGLTTIDYSVQECNTSGASCADVGASQTVTSVDTQPTEDTSFTDSAIAAGAWLRVNAGTVTWTTPGFISCTLRGTIND